MSKGFIGWAVLVALTAALVTAPAATAHAQDRATNKLVVPVTGTAAGVGTVAGNFSISRFAIQDSSLVALGTLTATVTDATGAVVRTFVTQAAMPVSNASGGGGCDDTAAAACDILNLVLGPLDLDLLGLQIHLNQVVLEITAQAGGGNLLGNLLCAITGLLDAGSLGQQLVNLLNQLVSILGSL